MTLPAEDRLEDNIMTVNNLVIIQDFLESLDI